MKKINTKLLMGDELLYSYISEEPLKKCVTDITEIKAKDGILFVSAIFDYFDVPVIGLFMAANNLYKIKRPPGISVAF